MHTRFSRAALGVCTVFACMALGSRALVAQATGTIRGHVVEAGSQRALGDVQVTVSGTQLGAVSNGNGDFTIANVPSGAYTVQARRIGYSRRSAQATVAAGTDARVDFALDVAATQLDAIVTTGTAGAVEKRTVGNAITQINAEDVTAKTNVTSVTENVPCPFVSVESGGRWTPEPVSLLVKWTVPPYDVTVFPCASSAVTVTSNAVPLVADDGAATRRLCVCGGCGAPFRNASSRFAVVRWMRASAFWCQNPSSPQLQEIVPDENTHAPLGA